MWLGALAVELFGKGPWPAAIGLMVLRDGEPVCLGRLRRSRTSGCRKFLAALKGLMLRTPGRNAANKPCYLWDLPAMKRLYAEHKARRRAASCWYTYAPQNRHAQSHIGQRPRCPHLWAAEVPLPLCGTEFLEGALDHLTLLLHFPKGYTLPAGHQVVCYVKPVRFSGEGAKRNWELAPKWLPLAPLYTQHARHGGDALLALRPVLP